MENKNHVPNHQPDRGVAWARLQTNRLVGKIFANFHEMFADEKWDANSTTNLDMVNSHGFVVRKIIYK